MPIRSRPLPAGVGAGVVVVDRHPARVPGNLRSSGRFWPGIWPYANGWPAIMRSIITDRGTTSCRTLSGGRLEQDLTYFHFHLVSD